MTAAIVLGLVSGLGIGLLATGVVLVYKANRFINLAQAQLGVAPAIILAKLVVQWGWNWWLALPVCLAVGVGTGIVLERLLIRPLLAKRTPAVSMLLLTIGIAQVLLALTFVEALGPSHQTLTRVGYPVPFHTSFTFGGLVLTSPYLLVLLVSPVAIVGLAAFLQYSMTGKRIRAAASNRDAARLLGISVGKTSAITWAIAGGLSALAAILEAPARGSFNDASFGPELLLRALGAAALGGFVSIPAALIGGVAIGVVEQVVLQQTSQGAAGQLAVFVVVLAIVLFRGRSISEASGKLSAETFADRPPLRVPAVMRNSVLVRYQGVLLAVAALAVGLLLPVLPYFGTEGHRFQLVQVVIYAICGVALTMVLGWLGQVSLGHFAVVGVGAYLTAKLAERHYSVVAMLALAAIAGALTLVLCGIPALRVRGMALTVTTLGLAVIGPVWLFRQSWLGTRQPTGVNVTAPRLIDGAGVITTQLDVYLLGLAVLALTIAATAALRASGAGRAVVAVRDNEAASAAMGLTPASVKLRLLALSGAVSAMAGVLWALAWGVVNTYQFPPGVSLSVLAVPVFGGIGSLGGAVAGAAAVFLPVFLIAPHLTPIFGEFGRQVGFQLALSGVGMVAFIVGQPHGIAGAAQRLWERWLERVARDRSERVVGADELPLVVDDVCLAFGGVQALDGVSLEVRPGEIVGLIGGNGAGKTTLMNVMSGVLRPSGGSVRMAGEELVDLAPEYRSAYGMARSFQDARLFPGLTVAQTVQLAISTGRRSGMVASLLAAPWVRMAEREDRREALELLDRLGLGAWADAHTAELSTGTRRICDLAAQMAIKPRLLLLDEPTAGVAQREAEAFGPLLRRIRDELDCSILVIEHDMPLLMGVCDRMYAMEAGKVIAEGTPEAIRNDPRVIASYLGTDAVAIGRSGATKRPARRPGPRRRPLSAAGRQP